MTLQPLQNPFFGIQTCGLAAVFAVVLAAAIEAPAAGPIQPYEENPFYWQYQGEPILLLGGTWQDNLFNHPQGLQEHLDLLKSVGGNYVRNVMSHRNRANVFAFAQRDGKFDLDQWNDEYWDRLENFLRLTHERDIIVQMEIWATWDHYIDHQPVGGWSKHPFNPANNMTYTPKESDLPTSIDYPPREEPTEHPFFRTVPELDNNRVVLEYQQAFVDKTLSHALKYPHVLYCMNNETGERLAWSEYWGRYVREKAREAGKEIHTAEMRRNEDIRHEDHRHLYDHPDRYTFLDISQNNTRIGQTHYDRILAVREMIGERPRPINNTKIYTFRGGAEESVQRFWRNIFAGCAAARFHRPHPLEGPDDHLKEGESGIGLSPRAQAHIKSLRMLTDQMHVFTCRPRNDLLSEREPNEAYALAEPGEQYAVYFPGGGSIQLDVSAADGRRIARWLDVTESRWTKEEELDGDQVTLEAPGEGPWAVLIRAAAD